MRSGEVLEEMAAGATLCMEHVEGANVWWLEPRRIILQERVAKRAIAVGNLTAGDDALFDHSWPQTWKAKIDNGR
jgi:hypothetical protein